MKITEITNSSDHSLYESLDRDNDTGFATADLVKIVKTHAQGDWEQSTLEEEMARLDKLSELDNDAGEQ